VNEALQAITAAISHIDPGRWRLIICFWPICVQFDALGRAAPVTEAGEPNMTDR